VLFPSLVLAAALSLFLILVFFFVLVQVGVIGYAFALAGIPPRYMLLVLFLSLAGSYVNIPLKRIASRQPPLEPPLPGRLGLFRFPRPLPHEGETTIALNVGGAVIPVIVSAYIAAHIPDLLGLAVAIAVVVVVCYRLAQPTPGLGIAMPVLLPPLVAAAAALVFVPDMAPPAAYVSGSIGTLIGADILHLDKVPELGARVASIGGAGTFDGIFLTGILAVLLAS
jgi:uncharacterized membrane protein